MHGISFLPTYRAISGPRQALPSGRNRRRVDAAAGACPAAHGDGDLRLGHERLRLHRRADRQGHSGLHWSPGREYRGGRLPHPHGCRAQRQPRDRRCPRQGRPHFRAGAGLGLYHAGLQKRHLRFRHARQDHDDLNADAHFHAGQPRSHDHDRCLPAAARRGASRRQGRHDHSRKLRILQFVPELLPDRCGHSRRGRRSSGLFQGSSGRGAVVPEICLPRPSRWSDRRQRRRQKHP